MYYLFYLQLYYANNTPMPEIMKEIWTNEDFTSTNSKMTKLVMVDILRSLWSSIAQTVGSAMFILIPKCRMMRFIISSFYNTKEKL